MEPSSQISQRGVKTLWLKKKNVNEIGEEALCSVASGFSLSTDWVTVDKIFERAWHHNHESDWRSNPYMPNPSSVPSLLKLPVAPSLQDVIQGSITFHTIAGCTTNSCDLRNSLLDSMDSVYG